MIALRPGARVQRRFRLIIQNKTALITTAEDSPCSHISTRGAAAIHVIMSRATAGFFHRVKLNLF